MPKSPPQWRLIWICIATTAAILSGCSSSRVTGGTLYARKDAPANALVGVFDRREIVKAYYESPGAALAAEEQSKRFESAVEHGNDRASFQSQREMWEGIGLQSRQASGYAGLENIADSMCDELGAIARETGVEQIVDRDEAPSERRTVDVTQRLAACFRSVPTASKYRGGVDRVSSKPAPLYVDSKGAADAPVGVFDRERVVAAYYGSAWHKKHMRHTEENMIDCRKGGEFAKAKHNEERLKRMTSRTLTLEEERDCLGAALLGERTRIAREAGVGRIVARADSPKGAPTVDVTERLVEYLRTTKPSED